MKKLVSIAVVLSLLVAAVVPATVAAWDPPSDFNLYARTPLGDLVGKVMKLSFSLLAKWVDQGVGNVTVQTYCATTGDWGEATVGAVAIGGLTGHGADFIAALADVITWGTDILADIVGMMAGVGGNATFP